MLNCNMWATLIGAAALAASAATARAQAIVLADILALEESATNFAVFATNQQAPPETLPNTTFNAPGLVSFINNGSYYMLGSTKAWGFFDVGRAQIDFDVPMKSVTILGRAAAEPDMIGPFAGGGELTQTDGGIEVINADGEVFSSAPLENISMRDPNIQLIRFDALELGQAIHGIVLVSDTASLAGPPVEQSLVFIGGLGITRLQLLPGDANNDELVSGGDLISVQQGFGNAGADDGLLPGDANDDGLVTGADLITVQENFGKALVANAVPEPAAFAVWFVAMACLIRRF